MTVTARKTSTVEGGPIAFSPVEGAALSTTPFELTKTRRRVQPDRVTAFLFPPARCDTVTPLEVGILTPLLSVLSVSHNYPVLFWPNGLYSNIQRVVVV